MRCKLCNEEMPGGPLYVTGPRGEATFDVCHKCEGDITITAIEKLVKRISPMSYELDDRGFCRVCGRTKMDLVYFRTVNSGDTRVCRQCLNDLRAAGLDAAGLPHDWIEQPHVCPTCYAERKGSCHLAPIVAASTSNGFHPTCPSNGGCEAGWRPKVTKKS